MGSGNVERPLRPFGQHCEQCGEAMLIRELQPDNSAIIPSPLPTLSPTVSLDRPTISRSSDDDQLWQHVETHLSAVLGCEATPHIYISLSQLVNNPLAQCLREILLATSAQMLTKQDHPRFEMIGRQKEVAAMTVLEARMGEWEMGAALMWDQEEQWTTLATILMMSHLKVSRRSEDRLSFSVYKAKYGVLSD